MGAIEEMVKQRARGLGFDLVGIAAAEPFLHEEQAALQRLRQGLMDGLPWYTEERVRQGTHPERLLPGARSILALGASYYWNASASREGGVLRGAVARYAWGRDYHRALKRRLRVLVRGLQEEIQRPIRARIFVDDGPMLDRAVAQRAGIGWYGKNTNVLTPASGSWVVLGQVVWDLELKPDAPLKKSCGQCTRCIEACPTGAMVAPYVVDNLRCISYWTIEHRGVIPREIRPLIGDWVFGCDLCQEVCPVNRKARAGGVAELREMRAGPALELLPLLVLTEEEFQTRFRGTAVMRATRVGLQRNACVALGNLGDRRAVPGLARALRQGEALVRGHAAWALGRLGGPEARWALKAALLAEGEGWVRDEIAQGVKQDGQGDLTQEAKTAKVVTAG